MGTRLRGRKGFESYATCDVGITPVVYGPDLEYGHFRWRERRSRNRRSDRLDSGNHRRLASRTGLYGNRTCDLADFRCVSWGGVFVGPSQGLVGLRCSTPLALQNT